MRIVIGVDGSEPSRLACDLVASRSWPTGTRACLVSVAELPIPWIGGAIGSRYDKLAPRGRELSELLVELADCLRRSGISCEIILEVGLAADTLLATASEWFADLVVVGSRGRGATASAVLGSVSAHLVDHAPCPVLVARGPRVERMLFATDGSRSCLDVPRLLASWRPAFHGMEAEVLSIATTDGLDGQRRIAADVADEMLELGWRASAVTRAGEPSREIVRAAEAYGADLLVTGSRCLGTLGRLLRGSVAHAVLLRSHASILVMRGHVPAPTRRPVLVAAATG